VPVPWDPSHVFYVWFDALLNYVTALGYARPGEDLFDEFWPANFHLIGKDILKFHAVFWPALLMAADMEVPQHLFIHGFLLSPAPAVGGGSDESEATGGTLEKMSKSRGNVIDPFAVVEEFGADALRHYLLREVTFGQDGPVSESGFAARYETELANEYGNLASRTIAMLTRYAGGEIPAVALDAELAKDFDGLDTRVAELLDGAEPSAALDAIWERVRRCNRYVEERAPWQLAKDPERAGELAQVLASLAEGLRVVSVLLHPYMPATVARLLGALGCPDDSYEAARFDERGAGTSVRQLEPLFPKQ
jgi:methionyl-tRNA synthetase